MLGTLTKVTLPGRRFGLAGLHLIPAILFAAFPTLCSIFILKLGKTLS